MIPRESLRRFVEDERFRARYDSQAEGFAAYVSAAIHANATTSGA